MKKFILSLLFLASLVCQSQESTNEKYQRARIYYNSQNVFNQLEQLGLALDHGKHKKNVYIESDFSESQIAKARQIGVKVDVIIDDVQKHYMNQNDPNHPSYVPPRKKNANCADNSTYTTPTNYNSGSMGGYLTYSQMLQELDDMKTAYPDLITTRANISTYMTSEGRGIQYVKISDNPSTDEAANEKQILYTAIHHAREPTSLQQTIFYMWYLLENYDSNLEIKTIVDNTELFFVPCVNPDGYIHNETNNPNGGGLWRKNRRDNGDGTFGVDNNRNYSYVKPDGTEVWNTAGTSDSDGDIYAGASVFSEPENQALRWLVEDNDFKVALNAHSFSNLLLFPFGYANNQLTEDHSTFLDISEHMVSENGYTNQIISDLYPAAGAADDFMYGVLDKQDGGTREKIFSMTPEIGSSFWLAASQIEDVAKEMLFLNISAAQIAGNYATISDNAPTYIDALVTSSQYTIKRLGLEDGDFTVSINPISTNIDSVGTTESHNGLGILEEQVGFIDINLNSSIAVGDEVVYELILNNGLYDKKLTITKIYGATTIILDDEADDVSSHWTSSSWGISTTEFNSPSSSITDSPNGNYAVNANETITLTNALDLTAASNALLTFYAKWEIENNYDYVQVQVSTDNGTTWIPQCGKYTNMGVSDQTGANNEPLYDGTQNSWVLEEIDLNDYVGSSILIRFQLRSDGFVQKDGFYFDDIKVKVISASLGTPDFVHNNVVLFPNPVKGTLNIRTNLPDYDYALYTIHGQLILENKNNKNNASIDYSNFASGIYLLEIEENNNKKTFKLVKE